MLARFKCNEIKNTSLAAHEAKISNFVNESDNREIPSNEFVESAKLILNNAIGNFYFR